MTPEQFAAALRKIDGVKSVETTSRKDKPPKVKIVYVNNNGISIGAMTVMVQPTFLDDRLKEVTLSQTVCFSTAEAELETTLSALSEKYLNTQRVHVVDENGVPLDTNRAFYNDETRVTVSVTPIENSYPKHLYGGTGLVASLNNLANSLADQAYNSAINACPADRGRKAMLKLQYVSQDEFAVAHAREEAGREQKARATKEGL